MIRPRVVQDMVKSYESKEMSSAEVRGYLAFTFSDLLFTKFLTLLFGIDILLVRRLDKTRNILLFLHSSVHDS